MLSAGVHYGLDVLHMHIIDLPHQRFLGYVPGQDKVVDVQHYRSLLHLALHDELGYLRGRKL